MKLWTIQHRDAWQSALRAGVLRADGAHVWPELVAPYAWMATAMALHLGPSPAGVALPVWAWPTCPDLTRAAHLEPGTPGVLIAFEGDGLWSDFLAWNGVLNGDAPGAHVLASPGAPGSQCTVWEVALASVTGAVEFTAAGEWPPAQPTTEDAR